MNDKDRIILVAAELNLPPHQWVLSGSGVMVMHGLRDHKPMGDIDIFVPTATWFYIYNDQSQFDVLSTPWKLYTTDPDDHKRRCDPPYLYKEMYGIEVNIFHSWRTRQYGNLNIAESINNAEVVDGIPCASLEALLAWKLEVKREKDAQDIAVLREALNR